MDQPVGSTNRTVPMAIRALVMAARRRRILDPEMAERFTTKAFAAQATTPDSLRSWLAGNPVPEDLASKLAGLLPQPGVQAFGPFPPLAHLADGGMGAVWLTSHPEGDGMAVVKVSQSHGNDRLSRRLAREASYTSRLVHQNIVRCLASGSTEDGTYWMAMEFLAHGDLRHLVERRGALPESVALWVTLQITEAMVEAHRLGFIHRDIKPGNIFMGPGGMCKLADFGIARLAASDQSGLTAPGTVLGSPAFMSPEQVVADDHIEISSDIYSIGCVLAYCLLGRAPYLGKPQEIMRAHMQAPIPDLAAMQVASAASAAVVTRCLAKKPSERFATPADLRSAILDARSELSEHGQVDPQQWLNPSGLRPAIRPATDVFQNPSHHDEPQSVAPTTTRRLDPTPSADTLQSGFGRQSAIMRHSPIRFREPEELLAAAGKRAGGANTPPPNSSTAFMNIDDVRPPAMSNPWLALLSEPSGGGAAVHLYAGPDITLGKLAKPPVQLTTLLYPIATQGERCNRISRSHCVLRSISRGTYAIEDLGSANGTMLDGKRMPTSAKIALAPGRTTRVVLADVLGLDLTPRPGGLRITRPDNRPEMIYAMVDEQMWLGPPQSDIPLPGSAGPGFDIARRDGTWMWRPHGSDRWLELSVAQTLNAGPVQLTATEGEHRQLA